MVNPGRHAPERFGIPDACDHGMMGELKQASARVCCASRGGEPFFRGREEEKKPERPSVRVGAAHERGMVERGREFSDQFEVTAWEGTRNRHGDMLSFFVRMLSRSSDQDSSFW